MEETIAVRVPVSISSTRKKERGRGGERKRERKRNKSRRIHFRWKYQIFDDKEFIKQAFNLKQKYGIKRGQCLVTLKEFRNGQANSRCPIQGDQLFAPTYVPRHSRWSPLDRVEAKKLPRGFSFSLSLSLLLPLVLPLSPSFSLVDRLYSSKGLRWRSATHPDIISRFII